MTPEEETKENDIGLLGALAFIVVIIVVGLCAIYVGGNLVIHFMK